MNEPLSFKVGSKFNQFVGFFRLFFDGNNQLADITMQMMSSIIKVHIETFVLTRGGVCGTKPIRYPAQNNEFQGTIAKGVFILVEDKGLERKRNKKRQI